MPIRNAICGPLEPGQYATGPQKILAGLMTGAFSICVASPTDIAKVRLQSQGQLPKEQQIYKSTFDCYRKTIARDGIQGLWLGLGPNIVRNSLINACEVATYDQAKQELLTNYGFFDGPILHCLCATIASANAAIVGCPADVIKTRTMNNRSADKAVGYVTLATTIYRKEGFLAFYKGSNALFARLACWNCIMFMALEQIKLAYYSSHPE